MSKSEKIFNIIGKGLIIILGVMISISAFADSLGIKINYLMLFVVTMLTTLVFICGFLIKFKYKLLIIIPFVISLLSVVLIFFKTIQVGVLTISNYVLKAYSEYYIIDEISYFEIHKKGLIVSDGTFCVTFTLSIIAIIYCFLLICFTMNKVNSAIHIGVSLVFFCIGMMFGKMPNFFIVSLAVFYYMILVMHHKSKRIYLIRIITLFFVVAFTIGITIIAVPKDDYETKNHQGKYYNLINRFFDNIGVNHMLGQEDELLIEKKTENGGNGGINGGVLGKFDQVKYSGAKMLKLTFDKKPSEKLYLKGYVGNIYYGDSFEDIDANFMAKYKKYVSDEKGVVGIFDYEKNEYNFEHITLKIDYEKANNSFKYYPYFSDIELKNNSQYYYSMRLIADYETEGDYEFSEINEKSYKEYVGDYYGLDSEYSICKDLYGQVPENIETLFDELLEKPVYFDGTKEGFDATINYVRKYLYDNTNYSLKPGKLKEGHDFVEDFLKEKKVGYCTSYASTATLMLRYLGLPSRYVEGYMISEKNISERLKQNGDFFEMDVLDNDAHAWTEVYVEGLGFVPVEMTKGYNGEKNGNREKQSKDNTENTTESNTENTTVNKEPTNKTENDETSSVETENNTDISKKSKLVNSKTTHNGKYFVVLLLVALVSIISIIVYKILENNKNKIVFDKKNLREKIILLGDKYDQYLNKVGIETGKYVLEEDIIKGLEEFKAIQKYQSIQSNENEHVVVFDIIKRARYGDENEIFTAKEYEIVSKYLEEFKKSLQYSKNRL